MLLNACHPFLAQVSKHVRDKIYKELMYYYRPTLFLVKFHKKEPVDH